MTASSRTARKCDWKLLRILTVIVWVVLAVDAALIYWGSFRGFDLTDEGYYLMNYAYPRHYPNWSGFIILGAKAVSWFHLDVVSLRWFRFFLLLLAHAFFAAAAVRWMKRRLLPASGQPWVGRFGFALLTASVTMPYVWTPPSLSYNDWAVVFGLLAAGCFLLMFSSGAEHDKTSPLKIAGWATGIGFMLGWLMFVKWSAAMGVGALLMLAAFCGWGRRWRLISCYLLGTVIGVALALGCTQVTCLDLSRFCHDVRESAAMLAGDSHRPTALLMSYAHDFWHTHLHLLRDFGWAGLLLLVWPEVFYRASRRGSRCRRCMFVAGILWGVTALAAYGDYFMAADKTSRAFPGHLAVACLAGAAWLGCRWHGRRLKQAAGRASQSAGAGKAAAWIKPGGILAGLVLLTGLPWAVAFGTGNSLLFPGAGVGAAWKALLVAGLAAAWSYRALRSWCLGLGVLSIALSQGQFVDGYIMRPYRLANPLTKQSYSAGNLPRGAGLLFDAKTADFLRGINERCQAAGMAPARPIIALYDLPGLVYLLGGLSPVTPWYFDPRDVPGLATRSLARIGGAQDSGSNALKPLLLVNEELDGETVRLLRDIGIDYPAGCTNLGSFHDPAGKKDIVLWAPK